MDKKINARKKAQRLARQRKMRNRRIALTICLMIAVCLVSVGGTIAWLTATSGTVTNTFTTGDINITLQEYAYNASENKLDKNAAPVTEIKDYKIYPGAQLPKEPFVTVAQGSEPCYVYACVENNLLLDNGTNVATITFNTDHWEKVGETGNKAVYKYKAEVNALTAAKQLESVFTMVTIDSTKVTKENIVQLSGDEIVINAYAHQSTVAGETTATTAALGHFKVTAIAG